MNVYLIPEYFWPGIGGLENSSAYLAEALLEYHSSEILTPVPGNGFPDKTPFPVRRFPDSIHGSSTYSAMWDYINRNRLSFAVCLFGFSEKWPQAQLDFIRKCRDRGAKKVMMKIPTLTEFTRFFSTETRKQQLPGIDYFICPNPVIREELMRMGISGEKALFVPNGVPVDRFVPADNGLKKSLRQRLGLPEEKPVFIFTGRFARRKRVDLLVEAFQQVPGAYLVLLGYFDNRFDEGSSFNVSGIENIRVFEPTFEVLPYLQAADFYVTASLQEGLSNSVLEAMSCGLPVIASNIPGHLEVIEPGSSGQLFSADNTRELVENIHWFIERIDSLPRFSAAARRTISAGFNISRAAATYHRLLSQC